MLQCAAIFVVVVLILYTLSAGKRADYIAAAFGPGSLLAAWWLLIISRRLLRSALWFAPLAGAAVLVVMTAVNQAQPLAPMRNFGDEIMAFAHDAGAMIRETQRPMVFCWSGSTHLQAMLGFSRIRCNSRNGYEELWALMDAGEQFWIVAGRNSGKIAEFDDWLVSRRKGTQITMVLRSTELPRANGWPERMTLFLVTPG